MVLSGIIAVRKFVNSDSCLLSLYIILFALLSLLVFTAVVAPTIIWKLVCIIEYTGLSKLHSFLLYMRKPKETPEQVVLAAPGQDQHGQEPCNKGDEKEQNLGSVWG